MKQAEIGPGVLDDIVQQHIASLQQGRERLIQSAATGRTRVESLSAEMAALERQAADQLRQAAGLEQQVGGARDRLADLIKAGAEPAALMAGAEELASATAELRLSRERAGAAMRQTEALRHALEACQQIADHGAALADTLTASVDSLVADVRELGSWMEIAQQSRALGLHVIRAQEEERRRLAREIHDGPTQLLNSVVLRIDVCQRLFDSDVQRVREELQQLKDLVRLSLQEMRKLIFDLRPMTLDDLGIVPALRAFLKDYQAKTGIETDFTVFGNDRRYDSVFEVAIFRLVQEALTNANKHAGASRVWVKVETTGGREIKVMVKDDGVGFEPEKVRRDAAGTKFGLVAMRERTELLGGSMEILSAPRHGTRLNFVFPLSE